MGEKIIPRAREEPMTRESSTYRNHPKMIQGQRHTINARISAMKANSMVMDKQNRMSWALCMLLYL